MNKLYEIINDHEYAIIEVANEIFVEDITYDEDDFSIHFVKAVTAASLEDYVIDCMIRNGEYSPKDIVRIWEGTVCGVTKEESVMVYVPESWD